MPKRNLLILTLLLAFAASVGLVLFGEDTHATELAPAPLGDDVAVETPTQAPAPAPVPAAGASEAIPMAAVMTKSDRVDTTGWSSGIVRGDIQLATSVLDSLESLSVTVEELRNSIGDDGKFTPPYRKTVPVERGIGSPIFEVRDIPFSDYPYAVSVYSPGLNGGRRTVSITAQTPLHDDIVLKVTPGRPFSVLVRDQDANPYAQVEVRLIPEGQPGGRKTHIGTTDGYGSAVFESVLAGDYRLIAGMRGVPLAEPEIVTVQSDARVYGNKIQGQGHTHIVRRGMPLQLFVAERGGYGVAEAAVKLQATDRVKLTVLDAVTDYNGNYEFPHVTPGKWMVQVTKQNYTPWTGMVTVVDGTLPDRIEATLHRVR